MRKSLPGGKLFHYTFSAAKMASFCLYAARRTNWKPTIATASTAQVWENKMDRNKKAFLYGTLLLIGLAVFVLEIFVFQKLDGFLGLMICIVSLLMILGSLIKLCRLSPKFEDSFLKFLDLLWGLP